MYQKLRSLIKRCYVTSVSDDSANYPTAKVSYLEKETTVEHLTPYGIYSNPPENSIGVVFLIAADEDNRFAIVNRPDIRFKNLKKGEVAVGNPLTLSHIKFDENGDITIIGKNNLNVTIEGNVNVIAPSISFSNGGSTDGFVKFSEMKAYIDAHQHTDPQGGLTGVPITQLSQSAKTTVVKGE
jgi:phage gp45-like